MDEYASLRKIEFELCGGNLPEKYKAFVRRVLDDRNLIPAADVAPVVRCKDCKWFADNNGGEWYGCQMFQVVLNTPEDAPKPDDFCSYGERKDGGADHDADDLGVGRCSRDVVPAAYCAGWNGLLGLIEKAPTVDAVVVTRCKDCKHKGWVQEPCHGKSVDYCKVWDCTLRNLETTFCSYGERKDGGDG